MRLVALGGGVLHLQGYVDNAVSTLDHLPKPVQQGVEAAASIPVHQHVRAQRVVARRNCPYVKVVDDRNALHALDVRHVHETVVGLEEDVPGDDPQADGVE